MDNVTPLSPEDMEKVSGGSAKTIQTRNAIVYAGAGTEYGSVGTLSYGTTVNFTGTVSYNDRENKSFYEISSPVHGWVTKEAIGV